MEAATSDTTGGALTEQTDYQYGRPAWHYDDNQVVQAKYRTYGQFRGYASVTTLTGDGVNNPQTKSVTAYYQGMSDDNDSAAVTVTDSLGGKHDDADQLAGQPLETTVYNGNGGPADHYTIDSYWVSAAAATQSRPGLPDLTANMVEPAGTYTAQALTDGGTASWRDTETDTSYDAAPGDADFGLATYVYTHTVPVNSAYDECTATAYAPVNASENLAGLVASAETDSVACAGFTVIAGDSTLDGAPASALNSTRPQPVSILEKTYGASFKPVGGQTEIDQIMSQAGPGARGIVFGSRGANAGHVFNVINQAGVVRYIDFQTGTGASFDGYQGFYLLRTNG